MTQINLRKIVLKGHNSSYSFKDSRRLYYATLTGAKDDGNDVIFTDEPLVFANTEYQKFSVQTTAYFYPEEIRQETAKIVRSARVRLVDEIPVETETREIYLPKSKCLVNVAIVENKQQPEIKSVVVELISYQHDVFEYCPFCYRRQKSSRVCVDCQTEATEYVKVWELDGEGDGAKRKEFFGKFPDRETAEAAVNAFCRQHAIESGAADEHLPDEDFAHINENLWEFQIVKK